MEKIIKLIFCHLLGDYVLQNDFIAKTKSTNYYHLLVHCVLYVLPFYLCFGFDCRLLHMFITHLIIDLLKTKGLINYLQDQVLHYIWLAIYW